MKKWQGLSYNVTHYFSCKLNRQLSELYASVALKDFAVAAIAIFEPIYLWTVGFSLQNIVLFYLLVYGIYIFTMPLGGKFAAQVGYEKTIFISSFFLIFLYLCLFLIPYHPVFIILAVAMYVLRKTLYWPAFHGDFAQSSDKSDRGRETASVETISMFVYVLGPLAGGFIIKFFGFSVLFFVVSIIILLSNIPMLITKEKVKKFKYKYLSSFKMITKKENLKNFLAYIGFGEELVVMVVWPIFIYMVIKDFFNVGGLVALATLVTGIVLLFIGRSTDKRKNKNKIVKTGAIFYSFTWLIRLLASTGLHVFFIDSFSRVFKNVIYVPVMALTYDRASKKEILKSVIFFEQGLAFGKFLAALIIYILLFFFSGWTAAFVIAAGMTFLYILI